MRRVIRDPPPPPASASEPAPVIEIAESELEDPVLRRALDAAEAGRASDAAALFDLAERRAKDDPLLRLGVLAERARFEARRGAAAEARERFEALRRAALALFGELPADVRDLGEQLGFLEIKAR